MKSAIGIFQLRIGMILLFLTGQPRAFSAVLCDPHIIICKFKWHLPPNHSKGGRKWDVITNRMSVNVARCSGGYQGSNAGCSVTKHMYGYPWSPLIIHQSLGSLRWKLWDLISRERYCPSIWPALQCGFSNGKLHWSPSELFVCRLNHGNTSRGAPILSSEMENW